LLIKITVSLFFILTILKGILILHLFKQKMAHGRLEFKLK